MAPTNPAILIIPGGWHVPASYSKLTDLLKSSGYDVHVPALPSMNGVRPPTADLEADTGLFREYTLNLANAGRSIIVIVHSYSGQVATNGLAGLGADTRAQQGLSGGVVHILSLCAFLLREGLGMVDVVKHFDQEDLIPLAYDFDEDQTVLDRYPELRFINPDSNDSKEEVEKYLGTLKRWNGKCMYQTLTTERAAWRDIPITYVYTLRDVTIPTEYQKWMVETMQKEGAKIETVELNSGHSPVFSKPKEVAEIVDTLVARYSKE
ncbi:alpha/beta-hydrolase [Aspergillus sclerotioniger CBS 115572]|uniref:Alpha/beta-hydrolase n=1 Tax=Aspergillus sclerotioniger CBS 115572 TaxID=1450535 RepID=A0A317WW26_9EURO|nr:alpha/beta-hydrolase [Aspergillus sclerotioniger CBS 115572]PWY90614.1 alpha/beta-hydrolase [Aspergillus sclerotioniger CBS 115572]